MNVLFWGTPEFALPMLDAMESEGHQLVGVVTQPDRPAGRGRKIRRSAVKEWAAEYGYTVLQPERPRGPEFMSELERLSPDISVVAAYGHILIEEVLDLPQHGSINVHASLLPAYRGAAPINWAIANGEAETGVTIMRMVRAMDAGPIILQASEPIGPDDTAAHVTARLAELGAELLVEALALIEAGVAEEEEQDHDAATFAPKLDRAAARVEWSRTAEEVGCHIRGMDRVPGAWSTLGGEPVKLFRPTPLAGGHAVEAGRVVIADPEEGLVVASGAGLVRIAHVQPSGKTRMSAEDWIRGRGVAEGQRFE